MEREGRWGIESGGDAGTHFGGAGGCTGPGAGICEPGPARRGRPALLHGGRRGRRFPGRLDTDAGGGVGWSGRRNAGLGPAKPGRGRGGRDGRGRSGCGFWRFDGVGSDGEGCAVQVVKHGAGIGEELSLPSDALAVGAEACARLDSAL
jgi:hypothetical protein